jgi:integrase
MATGAVYKRCTCTDPATGRRLGTRCPKLRRNGTGWNPTHGGWAYQLELPTDGRRRVQLRRSGYPSRDNAQAELDHARSLLDLADGDPRLAARIGAILRASPPGGPLPTRDQITRRLRAHVSSSRVPTFGDYLDTWIETRRHKLAPTTVRSYEDHIRLYLKPHLGHIRLDQLTAGHFEAMFAAITDREEQIIAARRSADPTVRATARGRRPMKPASKQRLRATARKALNDAIRLHHRGLLTHNPATHLELPSGKPPKPRVWTPRHVTAWQQTGRRPSPVMVWTPTQAGAFLDHAETRDPDLYPLLVLMLHRGLRRGEAVGLPDVDVDLDYGEITITQQITTVGHKPITTSVKTDAGERTIPLDPTTLAVLRDYRDRREQQRRTATRGWPDTGLFFLTPTGHPWHPDTVSKRFDHLVTTSGLPPVRLHDLRHCAATYLRAAGADLKTVQETLGHADHKITADTYTSILTELERATAEAAANLVPRQRPGRP